MHLPASQLQVIRKIEAGKTQAQVAREYQISEATISKWRRELRQYKERAFAGRGHAYTDEARVNLRPTSGTIFCSPLFIVRPVDPESSPTPVAYC